MIAVFFAFLSTLGFVSASIVFRDYSRKISSLWMNGFKTYVSLAGFVVLVLGESLWGNGSNWSAYFSYSGVLLLLSGLMGLNFGDFFMLRAYREIGAGRTIMLYRLQPVLMAILGPFFFGEGLNGLEILGVLLMIGCALVIAFEQSRKGGKWNLGGVRDAIVGLTFDTVANLLNKAAFVSGVALTIGGANLMRTIGASMGFIVFFHYFRVPWIEKFRELPARGRKTVLVASFLGCFASLYAWLYAVKIGNLATITAVGGTGPLISVLCESIYDRKAPNAYAMVALVLSMVGFYFLWIGQASP